MPYCFNRSLFLANWGKLQSQLQCYKDAIKNAAGSQLVQPHNLQAIKKHIWGLKYLKVSNSKIVLEIVDCFQQHPLHKIYKEAKETSPAELHKEVTQAEEECHAEETIQLNSQ
jgi:hypothetical protein